MRGGEINTNTKRPIRLKESPSRGTTTPRGGNMQIAQGTGRVGEGDQHCHFQESRGPFEASEGGESAVA